MVHFKKTVALLALLTFFTPSMISGEDHTADGKNDSFQKEVKTLLDQAYKYHNSGNYEEALESYSKVIALDSKNADAYLNRANIFGIQGKYDLAISDYRKVNILSPNFADAYGQLGWYLILQGEFEEAREPCRKAFELDPDNFAWAVNLGHTYLLKGDRETARRYYAITVQLIKSEEELKKGPIADFALFIERGWQVEAGRQEMEWMTGEYERKKERKRKLDEANALSQKSSESYKRGKYEEAIGYAEKVIKIRDQILGEEHPDTASGLNNLSLLYKKTGRYEEAAQLHGRALKIWIRALGHEDPEVRVLAREALGKQRDSRAVPALIEALKDPDEGVRQTVAETLGSIGYRSAVPALIEALRDPDEGVRKTVAEGLGKIGYRSAVPALIEALKDPDEGVRRTVAEALGKIGDKRAVPAFIEALKDPDEGVRKTVAEGLERIGDKRAVSALIKALKDESADVRRKAAYVLGSIKDRSAVPALLEALKDPDDHVRGAAAGALGSIGDKSAVPHLIKALKDPDVLMRSVAAYALGSIGDRSAVPALLEALKDPDEGVRDIAREVLLDIGDRSFVPALIEALKDPAEGVRRTAAYALGKMGDKSAVPALIEALKDPDNPKRIDAAEALGKIGDRSAVPALLEVLKDPDEGMRYFVADALGSIGDKSAVPALLEALEDPDDDVRGTAAYALGKIGDKSAVPALIEALKDQDKGVRYFAAEALRSIGDRSAVPALLEALKDPDEGVRDIAGEVLLDIGERSSVSALIEALKDPDEGVRRKVAYALGSIGERSAVPVLIEILNDSDRWTMRVTAMTLMELGEVSELYHILEETADEYIFDLLRRRMAFIDNLDPLLNSQDPFLKSAGYYLFALKSREEGRYERQLENAKSALSKIYPEKETALSILSLWLKTQAELKLGMPHDAMGSINKAEELLGYLSNMEEENYEALFNEYTLYMKGEVYSALNKSESAEKAYKDALEELEELVKRQKGFLVEGPYFSSERIYKLEAMIRTSRGALRIKMGKEDLEKAVKGGRDYEANDSVEMENEEKRYLELARQKVAEGDYEGSQALIEELNLRRTKYINRRMKLNLADKEKQEQIEEYRKKEDEIESITRQIEAKARGKAKKDRLVRVDDEIKDLEKQRNKKRRELQRYVTKLKKTYPDIAAIMGAKPIELSAIQEQLPDDTAILQYMMLPDKLIVFVLTNEGIEIVETQKEKKEIKKKVRQLRREINALALGKQSRKIKPLSKELNDILIKPIEKAGYLKDVKVVGIAPNSFLHQLPFGVLMNDGSKYLIDRYNLFFINSTSILGVAMERGKDSGKEKNTLLAISNPDGTLKYADREVENISKLFDDKKLYSQKEAKKSVIQNKDTHYSILHLSTHGNFDAIDSTKSYLVMADSDLTVEEIWGLPLKGTSLTVLSACETGVGEVMSGDDVVSLENAFIYAGSPSVVATLWKVDDKSTAELMQLFYQNVLKGMTKSEALTEAQRKLKETYKHPFFWSAFTLRGDWR